ncbi:hypothetical protein DH2020_028946 [Rehmannia glutinosa]|uniref:Protein kinase domain-containing protein n=1 Tax=Rehmannia glutinosa TaxID=99300 RepID=A0ABR0VQ05_REHGL
MVGLLSDRDKQIGEILGGLKALMVLKHEISINPRQCCLLFDMLVLAFDTISEEIKQNLRLEDRNTKWRALELPMKELQRIFRDADLYIRQCIDIKDWWGRAISLHMNQDCVELHIHNLLCCFPVVIEAIETAAEISGVDQGDMQKRRIAIMQKYDPESIFSPEKYAVVWRLLGGKIDGCLSRKSERKNDSGANSPKNEQRLGELLLRKLNDVKGKLFPSSVLVGANDYFVRRRLGSGYPSGGGHLKEIHWLGENLALRTFYGDISPLQADISSVLSLSHPNVLQYLCAFYDEDRKEGFLVMELMSKDLCSYIKEHSGQRNRLPFSIPVAVDIMLQIARGMEYLHSKKIYLGDLNPSNILLKAKHASVGGFQAKVTGFGMTSIKSYSPRRAKQPEVDVNIWLAPEVLAELQQPGNKSNGPNYTEKADVYSFGMLCFELLTEKSRQDGHLQGEKWVSKKFLGEGSGVLSPVSQIPFQMFTYTIVEKEKVCGKKWDLATEGTIHRPASMFDDEQLAAMDDLFLAPSDRRRFVLKSSTAETQPSRLI